MITLTVNAQFRMGAGYNLALPMGPMKGHLPAVHGMFISGLGTLKNLNPRIQVGAEFGYNLYAYTNKLQTYTFTDGTSTTTNVNFTSNTLAGNALFRYTIQARKGFSTYLSMKGGYTSFYSRIFIEDPQDPDACRPLEAKTVFDDQTFTGSAGLGFQLDLARLSGQLNPGAHWLDFSAHYTMGGTISYLNVNNLHDHSGVSTENKPTDLTIGFVNVSTQNLHEHKVAEIHTTPLRMMEFRLSYIFKLNSQSFRR